MLLKEHAIYRCPDGRLMRARKEVKPYHGAYSWTLVPINDDSVGQPTRDRISELLFMETEKIYRMEFESGFLLVDTGWTVRDLQFVP
jgi:hypothetical protein